MFKIKAHTDLSAIKKNNRKATVIHWRSEFYGRGKYYRKFGYFPSNRILNISAQHGVYFEDKPEDLDLYNKALFFFYFSPRLTNVHNKLVSKKAYTIIDPTIFYRRSKGIKPLEDRKGTIFFPAHSIPIKKNKLTFNYYNELLKQLPDKCKPISICFHMHDIESGYYKQFLDKGYELVTVGDYRDNDYIENFYQLAINYRYSCSDLLGSYTYYMTELGIPFFLLKSKLWPFENKAEHNFHIKCESLFSDIIETPTEEQLKLVNYESGVTKSVSRLLFATIIFYALKHYYIVVFINKLSQKLKLKIKDV